MLTGVVLCLAIGLLAPYGIVFNYYWIGFNPSSPGALFFFFVLTFIVNAIVGLISRNFELSKADLVLIYCMLLMAVTVPTWGLMFFLIGTLVYPFYYATPENSYAELFYDYIPSWMVPQDFQAIKDYYEGLPQGAAIPWSVWVEPMGWWLSFIIVLSFMLICMSAILHRQWSVYERLTYPMVQLPQNMIDKGVDPTARLAPFFKNKTMWLGFAIPCILLSLNAFNHYFPIVPQYSPNGRFSMFNQTLHLPIALNLAWVGFFYLVNLEITFSIWFFYVLSKLQEGVFNILGIASTERLSAYEYSQPADLTHQAAGAVIMLVLFGLWNARSHLKEVAQKLWDPEGGVDDSQELLRYRTALYGFLGSLLFVGAWLWRSGVPITVLPILLIVSLIFFILVARVVATGGVATARSPIVPAYFIISGLGTSILGAKGLVALNFTFIWQGESRTSPMVACSNGLKLAEMIPGSKTRLFLGYYAGTCLQPRRGGLYDLETGLHLWRDQSLVDQLGRCTRLALRRPNHPQYARSQYARLALHRHRRHSRSLVDGGATPVVLVALPPRRFRYSGRMADQSDLVLGADRLDPESSHRALRWREFFPKHEAILSRLNSRRGRNLWHLGRNLSADDGKGPLVDQYVNRSDAQAPSRNWR